MIQRRKGKGIPRLHALGASLVVLAALAGCSDLRQAIGIEKSVPDESKVTETPPLSIPPDFTLRPPRPGATGPDQNMAAAHSPPQPPQQPPQQLPQQQAAAPAHGQPPQGAYPADYPNNSSPYGVQPAYPQANGYPQPAQYPGTMPAVPGYAAVPSAAYGTDAYFQGAVQQYNASQGSAAGYSPYPAYNQPAYPGYAANAYPAYQQPAYQQPAYQQPAYQQPAYQQPSYQQPAYQQPAYGAPPYPPAGAPQPAAYNQGLQPAPANPPANQTGIPPAPPGPAAPPPAPASQAAAPPKSCDHVTVDAWGDYTCH